MPKYKYKKRFQDEIICAVDKLSKAEQSVSEEMEFALLKQRCKKSKVDLNHAFDVLMDYLKKNDSRIRYNIITIINEIYLRSHVFRLLVHERLYEIFVYTIEIEIRTNPLPLPVNVANRLKMLSLKLFFNWFSQYESSYRKLQLGKEFLKNVHKVDFVEIERKIQQEKAHREFARKQKLKELENEMSQLFKEIDSYKDVIRSNLKQMSSCFELIIPKLSTTVPNIMENELSGNAIISFSGIIGSEIGVSGREFSVEISISRKQEIYESDDNREILTSLTELYKELSYQLARLKKWLLSLKKYSCKDRERIIELFELKVEIEDTLRKYDDLDIIEEDNDEFIDVPESSF